MTELLFWIMFFLTGFVMAKCHSGRRSCLTFYTKNKGRTWWWGGYEFQACKLTDQLQAFYYKARSASVPNNNEFYDN